MNVIGYKQPWGHAREESNFPNFIGPFKGRVEQRNDPDRLGRLKVRVASIHAEDIPIDHLPWCWPMSPSGSMSGLNWVPPIGAVVWVSFEQGDHAYPRWEPGFWPDRQTAQGKGLSAHRTWPTSWYGSENPYRSGILKSGPGNADDAPNNFTLSSPLQRRIELDDRNHRTRLLIADPLDNLMWVNSEDGVITLEAAGGLRGEEFRARGLTLSSNSRQKKQAIQLYSHQGWLLTIDDNKEVGELAAPSGMKLRLYDAAGHRRAELWSAAGHRLLINDEDDYVQIRTHSNLSLLLDDKRDAAVLHVGKKTYLRLDLNTGDVTVRTEGKFHVYSKDDIDISSEKRVYIDGKMGVYINSRGATDGSGAATPAPMPLPELTEDTVDQPHVRDLPLTSMPPSQSRIDRACDYPYYQHVERVGS